MNSGHDKSKDLKKSWLLAAGVPFLVAFVVGIGIGAYEVNKDSGKTLSATGREETLAEAGIDCLQTGLFFAVPAAVLGLIARIGFAAIISCALLLPLSVQAQGLKGAPVIDHVLGRPAPLLPGKDDKERWASFSKMAPKLIHMTYGQVVKELGEGETDKQHSYLVYSVTDTKEPSTPGSLSSIELTIGFEHSKVEKFTVQAVTWGNGK